jgi:brefeldin A-resistance guanine nucleotide exchange factor 1
MHDVVRTVFARLFDLDPAIEEPKLQSNMDEDDSELKLSVGANAVPTMPGDTSTESGTPVEPSGDQNALPPPPAAVGRTECTSLTNSER